MRGPRRGLHTKSKDPLGRHVRDEVGILDFAQRFAGETLRSAKDDIDFGAGDLVLAIDAGNLVMTLFDHDVLSARCTRIKIK